MSKEIKFNIKLLVDGKEQLVTATTSVAELKKNLESAKTGATKLREALITFNQVSEVVKNASDAVNKLNDVMAGLAASYRNAQQANAQLKTIMEQRINATDEDIKKVNEVIKAQTELGVVSGTVQRMGAQQIATFLKEKGTLETLIPAMNDLVVQQKGINASQEDARGVANLMGKAMMGQTSALKRVGITFSDAQANIMKYGDEQQKASMLAQIITENVGHMNAELAKTDAGQLKQLEMGFASVKVKIGEMVSQWQPFVAFGAQALTVATSVITLGASMRGVATVMQSVVTWVRNLNIVTSAWNIICTTSRVSVVGFSAVLQLLRASFFGAAIGATTLKVAIKTLLISTGVGIAIWALTEAISYFVTASDEATDSTNELTEAEQAAQAAHQQEANQIAEVTASLNINITRLKEFKGTKAQEQKLVEEMNNTYGDALGYYSSVADWYQALVANSENYCNQMINEIRIRNLANQAAQLDQQEHDLQYDEKGNKRNPSKEKGYDYCLTTPHIDEAGYLSVYKVWSTPSDYDKQQASLKQIRQKKENLQAQMRGLVKENANLSTQVQHTKGYSLISQPLAQHLRRQGARPQVRPRVRLVALPQPHHTLKSLRPM